MVQIPDAAEAAVMTGNFGNAMAKEACAVTLTSAFQVASRTLNDFSE